MFDPADLADKQIEDRLRHSLSLRKPEGPRANGACLNCESALPPGLRWCDTACRDDWEALQKINGGQA